MTSPTRHFHWLPRLLHWSMAVLIVAMLFIGIGMVGSVSSTHEALIRLHKPLGILILLLALLRVCTRLAARPPALPTTLPRWQKHAAHASHWLLYGLMIAMPLIGWAMLSAAGDPIVLGGGLRLPPIAPQSTLLYAYLRQAHTVLAFGLFATILGHVGAALHHGLIRRDGVFSSMARGRRRE
ncbi:cytochrome b [Oleiagrimonas soli]|uniref:Cytochrome b561 n=1 Tax=Oleiagrimonas soli TaxID=1543381 RepID=A0A099CX79_9GAMM|nr:cytochrome b [Oleiagrimonas soli]KGI78286.1 cytochrome B561 [Oleiagrimonas soli]MBB6183228.1 cytochrome b561 [Oleiagrimonas soli]